MPAASARQSSSAPVLLVCAEDEFAVKQRAKQAYAQWAAELGGMDHETIDASVSNTGEALKVIARLREALNTLPFFGSGKVVWLQNCTFLGDERTASTAAVTEVLAELAQELKTFQWQSVRLIVSAGKVDKRKVFYKTIEKIGSVENLSGWSAEDRDWASQAEAWVIKAMRGRGKEIPDDAAAELVARVGPNSRQMETEVEKLSLYVGDRPTVTLADVEAVSTRNKSARAFAVGDALGDRDLPRLLRCLDEELWEVKLDSQKSPIGVLYGLISKVRSMILLKEILKEGWVQPRAAYGAFKAQLESLPAERLPKDKRYNPAAINAYVLYKSLPQASRYSEAELIQAMDILLRCNQQMVSSGLEDSLVLQQSLVQIVTGSEARPAAARR